MSKHEIPRLVEIDINKFLPPAEDDLLNQYTVDENGLKYDLPKIPKLEGLTTAQEMIEAKRFFRNLYKWTDEDLLDAFVKVTCMNASKLGLPTRKDLEKELRKLKKKQAKKK